MSTDPAVTGPAARDPRAVVVDYVNAVARGDLDAVTAAFTEDVTWTYPGDLPLSGVWHGRDAVVGDFLGGAGRLFAPGSAVEVTLTSVLADGERVLAEWTSRGTTVHGLRYDNRCAGVFTVREGRIAAVREYTDTDHVARTLFADR